MKSLSRVFKFNGYKVLDTGYTEKDNKIIVKLDRDSDKPFQCHECGRFMGRKRGQHLMKIRDFSIFGIPVFIEFWRFNGDCKNCGKARNEHIEFLCKETPHYTKRFAEQVGTLCEFMPVNRVAEFLGLSNSTVRRLDLHRMERFLKEYKIPVVTKVAVDEVYARKKAFSKNENRNKKFFTIITDLDTGKVIWVSESRDKVALDQFFILLGKKACRKIKVVAIDQHDPYKASAEEHCKNATIVWDKFHIMKNFEEAVNDVRKDLHNAMDNNDPLLPLTMGRDRFIFLKKDSKRTSEEKAHISQVLEQNRDFLTLEIIKERMLTFFNEGSAEDAKLVLDEVTAWIWEAGFEPLKKWANNIHEGWETLKNYFTYRVTTAIAEGTNNVIKYLKRRAFGFRNMDYFKLKIMQLCGYLNSKFVRETSFLARGL